MSERNHIEAWEYAHAVLNSTPALDLSAHDEAVRRDALEQAWAAVYTIFEDECDTDSVYVPVYKAAIIGIPPSTETDLSKCPRCGGPADNGHDRCLPPSPYYCTKCFPGAHMEPTCPHGMPHDRRCVFCESDDSGDLDALLAKIDALRAKLEEAEERVGMYKAAHALKKAWLEDAALALGGIDVDQVARCIRERWNFDKIEEMQSHSAALTARVQALERSADVLLGELRQVPGPIFDSFNDTGRAALEDLACLIYSASPALDLSAHDEAVRREVVERIIDGLCFCHGELWPAGVRHGTGRPCPPWGEEEECGPPAGFTDRDKDALYRAAGIPPSTDTPTQEP